MVRRVWELRVRRFALAALAALVTVSSAQPAAAYPARRYVIPVARPRGQVEVQVRGIRAAAGAPWVRWLQVRIIITNDLDDTPWQLDTGQVALTIEGQGTSQAGSVLSDVGTPPDLIVPRGAQTTVDLFFAAPSTFAKGSSPDCSVSWSVQTGVGEVSRETSFGAPPAAAAAGPEPSEQEVP